jgi:uncharacterized delta-60 repeat protein
MISNAGRKMKRIMKFSTVLFLLGVVLCIQPSQAVTLDASFGQGGKVLTDFNQGQTFIHVTKLLEQSDGKIVAVGRTGYSRSYVAAMRFHPDGSVDASFGQSGKVILNWFSPVRSSFFVPLAALDGNDKIILAGLLWDSETNTQSLVVARLTRDGALDSTFSDDGRVIESTSLYPTPYSLAIDAQNRILIGGQSSLQSHDGCVARFRSDGVLDNTLDSDGLLFFKFSTDEFAGDAAYALTTDAQGRILLVTANSAGLIVARYTDSGALDNSFAGRGFVVDAGMEASSVTQIAVLESGRIAVSSSHVTYQFAQTRYLPNGARDYSFSGDGFATVDLGYRAPSVSYYLHHIARDGTVTIGIASYDSTAPTSNGYDINIARFTPAGDLDAAFGEGGKVRFSPDEGEAFLYALLVRRDKSVIFQGAESIYADNSEVLVGLEADGDLDTRWSGDGVIAFDQTSFDSIGDLALDAQRRIVAVGHTTQGATIARYLENGELDLSFGEGGKVVALETPYSYSFVLVYPNNSILVAGRVYSSDGVSRLLLKRFRSDGSADTSFGTQGSVVFSLNSPPESLFCQGISLTSEGKIVAALSQGLVRFHVNGRVDTGFGDGNPVPGYQRVSVLNCSSMVQDSSGRLVLGGYRNGDFAVARYNANGSLDTSFGSGGFTTVDLGTSDEFVDSVALAPDGKILAGGSIRRSQPVAIQSHGARNRPRARLIAPRHFQVHASLVRLHSNGRLDASFADSGKLVLPAAQAQRFWEIAVDRQGRIWGVADEQDNFLVVRVQANGQMDEGFAPGGLISTDFGGYDAGSSLVLDASGRATVGGWSDVNGTPDFALARYEEEKITIADVTINESNNAQPQARFTVRLSGPPPQSVTVNYTTIDSTAKAADDYQAKSGTLTFAPGETSKTIVVTVIGDILDEANELFRVNLSAPVNAGIGDGQANCTIVDDDRPPAVAINDITISEGNNGQAQATFTVTLSMNSSRNVYINAISYNGTARSPADYASSGARLIFKPGEVSKTFSVPVTSDLLDEADETFYVVLSEPANTTIVRGRGVGIIKDDDRAPSLAINDVSIVEGNSGTENLTFSVSLSAVSGQTVTVNYATADGTARSTRDYTAKSGALSFAPGTALTRTISIPINGDTLVEGDETLYVILSGAVNATIGKGRGMGTINDDDTSG